MLLRHYLSGAGYSVVINEEDLIGVPLSNYIRENNAVIEISKPFHNTKEGYQWEYAKTILCKKAKIKLIRILKQRDKEYEDCVNITRLDNSDEALAEAISLALHVLGIDIETNVEADKKRLFKRYLEKEI